MESIPIYSNVEIYGGFDGTESERAARNPSVNTVLVHGDRNRDDHWNKDAGIETKEGVWFGTELNRDPYSRVKNYMHASSQSGNTSVGFYSYSEAKTNAVFDGIAFGSFAAKAIDFSSPAGAPSDLTIRNCAFFANNTSAGQLGVAVSVRNASILVEDSLFELNFRALALSGDAHSGDAPRCVVRRSAFLKNYTNRDGVGALSAGGYIDFLCEESIFRDNCSTGNAIAGLSVGNSGLARSVKGCLFESNRMTGAAYGALGIDAGALVEGCLFRANRAEGSATCAGAALKKTGNALSTVKDCAFVSNTNATAAASNDIASAIALSGRWLNLVNCTFEGNSAENGGSGSATSVLLYDSSARLGVANCAFSLNANSSSGGKGAIGVGASNTSMALNILNSVFWEDNPLMLDSRIKPRVASSLFKGGSLSLPEGSVAEDLLHTAEYPFRERWHRSGGLAPHRSCIGAESAGRPLWTGSDGDVYYHGAPGAEKPYFSLCGGAAYSAEALANAGVDIASKCIPDAFGKSRHPNRVRLGPVQSPYLPTILKIR